MADDRDRFLGRTLAGRYRLTRRLGRGGMGAVYEAEADDGARVAIKVIERALAAGGEDARRRFVREARSLEQLRHEHVVRVLGAGSDAEQAAPFIVMERLEGRDLASVIAEHGPLAPAAVATLFAQACRGLQAVHAAQLVHRDVKPSNLFLHRRADGELRLKVCDFGIAKHLAQGSQPEDSSTDLTRSGGVLGSPLYMSPEQARNARHVDSRSDVWSLGVSLYQALTGELPWRVRETVGEVLLAICTEPLPHVQDAAPWLSRGLAEVVHRAMTRDPARRYPSMAELEIALAAHGSSGPLGWDSLGPVSEEVRAQRGERAGPADSQTADAVAATPVVARRRRRTPLLVTAAAATLLLGWGLVRWSSEEAPPVAARGLAAALARPERVPDAVVAGDLPPALRGVLQVVPAEAEVTVDGRPTTPAGGRIELVGVAGQTFHVVARLGARHVEEKVVLTRNGDVAPAELVLPRELAPAGPGAPPPSTPPAAGSSPPPERPKAKESW